MQGLARREVGFFNRLPIDEGAIGRTTVPNQDLALLAEDFAVGGGNGGVIDLEIVAASPAQAVAAGLEIDRFKMRVPGFDDQPWHTLAAFNSSQLRLSCEIRRN